MAKHSPYIQEARNILFRGAYASIYEDDRQNPRLENNAAKILRAEREHSLPHHESIWRNHELMCSDAIKGPQFVIVLLASWEGSVNIKHLVAQYKIGHPNKSFDTLRKSGFQMTKNIKSGDFSNSDGSFSITGWKNPQAGCGSHRTSELKKSEDTFIKNKLKRFCFMPCSIDDRIDYDHKLGEIYRIKQGLPPPVVNRKSVMNGRAWDDIQVLFCKANYWKRDVCANCRGGGDIPEPPIFLGSADAYKKNFKDGVTPEIEKSGRECKIGCWVYSPFDLLHPEFRAVGFDEIYAKFLQTIELIKDHFRPIWINDPELPIEADKEEVAEQPTFSNSTLPGEVKQQVVVFEQMTLSSEFKDGELHHKKMKNKAPKRRVKQLNIANQMEFVQL